MIIINRKDLDKYTLIIKEKSSDSARESTSMVVWADDERILFAF
jgi:hypothetical protein